MAENNTENRNGYSEIVKFVNYMTEKNYAEANKYLQVALDRKFKQRIKDTANRLGF